MRKPYICGYPPEALEKVNHAIENDATISYLVSLCRTLDPIKGNPTPHMATQYKRWYLDQKRINGDRQAAIQFFDGTHEVIEKALKGDRISSADLLKAQASLVSRLRMNMDLLQEANISNPNIDRSELIGKFVTKASDIFEKMGKLTGAIQGDTNQTFNIYNFSAEEIFKELFHVVIKTIKKNFPQQAMEIQRVLLAELSQYMRDGGMAKIPAIDTVSVTAALEKPENKNKP